MKDFFGSKKFKILVAVFLFLCSFMVRAAYTGGVSLLTQQAIGVITTPLRNFSSSLTNSVDKFFDKYTNSRQLYEENERLKEQIRQLNEKLLDYDTVKHENEIYKNFLQIKSDNPDFEFEPASVIGRDPDSRFYSFTINKGALAGISVRDPVITADGLVGVVTEVGLTYSKVMSILDVSLNVGAYITRTRDTGIVSGTVELSEKGLCKLSYLPRDSAAAIGDIVVTSGTSGVFPGDVIIGTILEVKTESHGNSMYAVIDPAADIISLKNIVVIKSFQGQGAAAEDF